MAPGLTLSLLLLLVTSYSYGQAPTCELADIIIVLDSSGSIGADNWPFVLTFAKNIVDAFEVGEDQVRFGLNYYGNEARLAFHLNTYNTKDQVLAAIDAVPWLSQNTNTSGGIRHMHRDMFTVENGARDNVPRIAIIITDGASTFDKDLTIPEADAARLKGIILFAIGIGEATSQTELEGIANKPSAEFVFKADSFIALDVIKQAVVDTTCRQVATACNNALDVLFLVDSSTSICAGSEGGCQNWDIIKDFMGRVVQPLSSDTRVSVVTFGGTSVTRWSLNRYQERTDLMREIANLPYSGGEDNLTFYQGLSLVEQEADTPAMGARADAPNVIILISDGVPTAFSDLIMGQANRVNRIATVHGILIGAETDDIFDSVVSGEGNQQYISNFTDFETFNGFDVEELTSLACGAVNKQRPASDCNSVDLVLLVDESGSICADEYVTTCDNWERMKIFMMDIVEDFDIGPDPDNSHAALVTFGNGANRRWDLDQYDDPASLRNAIASLSYEAGQWTNTFQGLRDVNELLTDEHNKAVLILTDGLPTQPEPASNALNLAISEAQLVQEKAEVIAVGIESGSQGIDESTLQAFSSQNYFKVANFADLPRLLNQLHEYTCVDRSPNCENALDVVFLVDSSGSVCDGASSFDCENWDIVRDFMVRMARLLSADTRVSAVTFSNDAIIHWDLDTYSNIDDLSNAIRSLPYTPGLTNLYQGFLKAEQAFSPERGGRTSVPDVVIVLSDGEPNVDVNLALAQARRLQDMATVFGFIVGTSILDFSSYVSQPATDYLQVLEDFPAFRRLAVTPIVRDVCDSPNLRRETGDCNADVIYLLDTSGSICNDTRVSTCHNWDIMKFFFRALTLHFDVGPADDQSSIALITFGNRATLEWGWDTYTLGPALDNAIINLQYTPEQTTATDQAFERARILIGDKKNVGVVILTDGRPTREAEAKAKSELLQQVARTVVAVGVDLGTTKGLDLDIIEEFSTQPREQNQNWYIIDDVNELTTLSNTLIDAACPKSSDCDKPVDVCFVVDRSGSVGPINFEAMQAAFGLMVQLLDVDTGRTRVCLIAYSTDVEFVFSLNRYSTSDALIAAMNELRYDGGRTNTAGALDMAINQAFQSANGDRPDVPNLLVVMTDGGSTDKAATIISAVEAKKIATVLTIGIGGWTDEYELKAMASHPYSVNYWPIETYDALKEDAFTYRIRDFVCRNRDYCGSQNPCQNNGVCVSGHGAYYCDCPPENPGGPHCEENCRNSCNYVFAMDASGSIGKDNFMLYMDFAKDVMMNLPVGQGANVGLMTFSNDALKIFDMNTYNSMQDVLDGMSTAYFNGGRTNTAAALRMMRDEMFTEANGMDPSKCNVGVVITDGRSNDHLSTWQEAIDTRESGIQLVAVGVGGNADEKELRAVASYPTDVNTITVDSVSGLSTIVDDVSQAMCGNINGCGESNTCLNSGQCRDILNSHYCKCGGNYTHKDCGSNCDGRLDIVFLIDRSGSIRRERFVSVQTMLAEVIDSLETWDDKTRVAVISFSDNANVEFHFNTYSHKQDMMEAILRISYNENGRTNIAEAISLARSSAFLQSNGDRPGVQNLIMLFSDGAANINPEQVIPEATQARIEGALVIAAAVGNDICMPELRTIASYPPMSNIYDVVYYQDIFQLTDYILGGMCNDVDECSSSPCVNGGQCIDMMNTYQCYCTDSQTGERCERPSCRGKSDIAVVLDTSGSIDELFELSLPFIRRLVYCLEFRMDTTRMALVSFSDNAEVMFNLDAYQSQQDILNAIQFAKTGGRTNTQEALTATYNNVLWGAGSRSNVDKKVILISDGGSNVMQSNTIPAGQALRSRGAELYVVAVGNSVDSTEVNGLASGFDYVVNVPETQDVPGAADTFCNNLCN